MSTLADLIARQAERAKAVAESHASNIVWCCASDAEACFSDMQELFSHVRYLTYLLELHEKITPRYLEELVKLHDEVTVLRKQLK